MVRKEYLTELIEKKKTLSKKEMENWSKEDLLESCLFLHENNLKSKNEIIRLFAHWKNVLRNIACSECAVKFNFDDLGGVKLNKSLFCQECLKTNADRINKLNKEPNKEELEEQLKNLEGIGVKQYLANSEQIYFNQIENIKKKILVKDLEK